MFRAVIISLLALTLLGGCVERAKRVYFDGKHYPTRGKAVSKDDRKAFIINVRKASQGLAGAREAGRHGGSRYCIETFGTSEIEWAVGPDSPDEVLVLVNGNLQLSGRCVTW